MTKKRANGEGSIRRKPNGRWEGRYTLGIDPATGRAVQKSVSAKTRAECKEKLDRAIRDNRGIPMDHNEDYTVAEWCRLWFETYSKPVIRPNTAKNYRNIIEEHIIPAIGMVKLKRLTAIQIQQMYNDAKARGRVQRFETQTNAALSGSTVRRIHMALSQQAVDILVREHEQHPDNPILFPSPRTGGYWSPDAVSRINWKLLAEADIEERVRFHDLRHTFATMALSSGVDVKTLSSMLGHYSAGFTLDTYTHITNDMQRGAAEKIGGFMETARAKPEPEPPDPPEESRCKVIPFERVG
mgnify:CR=1 FL=1